MESKRKIIVIVGPTASGKTSWGVPIAKKYNGEIISADSRQVYRGLNIGTSKDLKDYGDVKYRLIDIKNPGEEFTLFEWLKLARSMIEDIFSRGKLPIIVGGTGLYVQALTEGFALEKAASCQLSAARYSRKELEGKSLDELLQIFQKLEAKSQQLKAIDENNHYRLIRAIERAQSGEVINKKKPDFKVLQIAIDLPREVLYQRIDQRVDEWFLEGFMEEVQGLLDAGVDPKWLEKIGLEYRILTEFLLCHSEQSEESPMNMGTGISQRSFGKTPQDDKKESEGCKEFDEMKQKMKFAIHAYARRQLTWFRRFPEIIWAKDLSSAEKEIKKFLL